MSKPRTIYLRVHLAADRDKTGLLCCLPAGRRRRLARTQDPTQVTCLRCVRILHPEWFTSCASHNGHE